MPEKDDADEKRVDSLGMMTIQDVVNHLRLNTDAVDRIVQNGELAASGVGENRRFRKKDVDKWAKENLGFFDPAC